MTPPQWVLDELARREADAKESYQRAIRFIPAYAELFTEEEYVKKCLEQLQPITWTNGGAA